MKKLSKEEQDIFFAVIRAAIWEHEVECDIPESTDWESLIQAFDEHSILGVVASTLMTLSTREQALVRIVREVLMPHIANLTRTHAKQNIAIAEAFERLESNGCHPVLLKGQGLSALYPKTCVRSCGDIDLYVRESEYVKACEVINNILGIDNETADIYKHPVHYHAEKGSAVYEVHRVVINDAKYFGNNKKTNRLALLLLTADSLPCLNMQGKSIKIPSSRYNDWYIFFHLYKHFVKAVGIRQFIDWLFVIKANKQRNIERLHEDLEVIGLAKEWNQLGYILTHFLGLPQEAFPLYDAEHHTMTDYEIQRIINCGDFGKSAHRNLPYKDKKYGLSRALSSFIYHTSKLRTVAKNRSWGYALYSYKKTFTEGIKKIYKRMWTDR